MRFLFVRLFDILKSAPHIQITKILLPQKYNLFNFVKITAARINVVDQEVWTVETVRPDLQ